MSTSKKKTLAEVNPEAAKQWHPTKNGSLTPNDVSYGSGKIVWWLLPYDDPKTGHHDFEWESPVRNMNRYGCPYLTGQAVWPGFNDLATLYPEIAKEWHPSKNGTVTPQNIRAYSNKSFWWLFSYDDPKTGQHFDFEWEALVSDRTRNGAGCPYLYNKAVWVGYNDLATINPDLAKEWHPTKNGGLTPLSVTAGSATIVWWLLPYDDPKTGKHFNFEWRASIADRHRGRGCPYLSNKAVWVGYNDLATTNPNLSKQWDHEKNGSLTPQNVTCGSHKSVWWKCDKGHSWQESVYNRNKSKYDCPHCVKALRTSIPEQTIYYYINQLFPDACNGDTKILGLELDVYIPSKKMAIEYDGMAWHKDIDRDLKKNKKCRDNGIHMIRIREVGCPKMKSDETCTVFEVLPNNDESLGDVILKIATFLNKDVDVNINRDIVEIRELIDFVDKKDSLCELHPNIAKEWHPTKNGNLKPTHVKSKSSLIVWWLLQYDDPETGKHFDFEWEMAISDRTVKQLNCPYLSNHKIFPGFNDLATKVPKLAAQWNYAKNNGLRNKKGEDVSTPDKIAANSNQKVWWKCDQCGCEWEASVNNRNNKSRSRGCPICHSKISRE